MKVAKKLGLTELDPFLSVTYDCHHYHYHYHYHYRLPGTRSREEMQKFLREKGFRLVDTIEAPKKIP